jgi:hypothetical protein
MTRRQKRPAQMTTDDAQRAARMICGVLQEDGISPTDTIGIFLRDRADAARHANGAERA